MEWGYHQRTDSLETFIIIIIIVIIIIIIIIIINEASGD